MDHPSLPSARGAQILRWTARLVGLLFIGIFLTFFIADWVTKGGFPVERDRIPMTIALFMSFVGLLIAWKWDGVGGILALVSILAFAALGLQTPAKPAGTILLCVMYLLPAVLFILSWRRTRTRDRSRPETAQP
jgi:hypothetical protein